MPCLLLHLRLRNQYFILILRISKYGPNALCMLTNLYAFVLLISIMTDQTPIVSLQRERGIPSFVRDLVHRGRALVYQGQDPGFNPQGQRKELDGGRFPQATCQTFLWMSRHPLHQNLWSTERPSCWLWGSVGMTWCFYRTGRFSILSVLREWCYHGSSIFMSFQISKLGGLYLFSFLICYTMALGSP